MVHFQLLINSREHFSFAKRGRNHTRLEKAPFRFRFELRASRAPRRGFVSRGGQAGLPHRASISVSFRFVWRSISRNRFRLFVGFECHPTVQVHFWCFWLTIQNTANRKVRNLFHLLAEFISFSGRALLRCQLERTRSSAQRARTRVLRYWRLQKKKKKKKTSSSPGYIRRA